MTITTIQPDTWAKAKGYANGMLADDGTLHIGGQIGWNSQQVFEAHDFVVRWNKPCKTLPISSPPPGAALKTLPG